jgi:hypothetical protein
MAATTARTRAAIFELTDPAYHRPVRCARLLADELAYRIQNRMFLKCVLHMATLQPYVPFLKYHDALWL